MIAWLKWLFCPHTWDKVIAKNDVVGSYSKIPMYTEYLYQCSKCSRFKRVRSN